MHTQFNVSGISFTTEDLTPIKDFRHEVCSLDVGCSLIFFQGIRKQKHIGIEHFNIELSPICNIPII
jgi:hypothetical protein